MPLQTKVKPSADIPTFTSDVQVTDEIAKDLIVSHIVSDDYKGGLFAGECMMKVNSNQGKVAIITYPEVTSCILRVNGDIESVVFSPITKFL